MAKQLFRKQVMDRLSSPEELNDYLKVTDTGAWAILVAVVLLIIGAVFWGFTTFVNSSVSGAAVVENGRMQITFDDDNLAGNMETGLTVKIGNTTATVDSVGTDENGKVFATADTTLADGKYTAEITYKTTQLITLLFN